MRERRSSARLRQDVLIGANPISGLRVWLRLIEPYSFLQRLAWFVEFPQEKSVLRTFSQKRHFSPKASFLSKASRRLLKKRPCLIRYGVSLCQRALASSQPLVNPSESLQAKSALSHCTVLALPRPTPSALYPERADSKGRAAKRLGSGYVLRRLVRLLSPTTESFIP
jgi:hypothetical protein